MKNRHILFCLAACCSSLVMAQLREPITLANAEPLRNRLEASLKDYLVAFDSQLSKERYRVGLPLASFANKQVDVAYDLSGKNVMAQWRFAQSSAAGQRFDYQAYVGASGSVSLVLSSRF